MGDEEIYFKDNDELYNTTYNKLCNKVNGIGYEGIVLTYNR